MEESGRDVWLVFCTAPDAGSAESLGRAAVEGGHAACANLVPALRSLFRWKDGVQAQDEILIVFKTTTAAWPGLAELVRLRHPYEVPELIALPVAAGLAPYLAWVRESVAVDSPRRSV